MVIEFVGLVVVRVLNQKFERTGAGLAGLERVAQNVGRVLASVHRDQLHARPDAGSGSGHTLDGVGDGAVFAEFEADRVSSSDDASTAFATAKHLRGGFVIDQLPSAAFDAAQWSSGS